MTVVCVYVFEVTVGLSLFVAIICHAFPFYTVGHKKGAAYIFMILILALC